MVLWGLDSVLQMRSWSVTISITKSLDGTGSYKNSSARSTSLTSILGTCAVRCDYVFIFFFCNVCVCVCVKVVTNSVFECLSLCLFISPIEGEIERPCVVLLFSQGCEWGQTKQENEFWVLEDYWRSC